MIELDQSTEQYQAEFGRFKEPPTHAHIISIRWALPLKTMDHRNPGFDVMLRPHVEAVYVLGRIDADGNFIQTKDDGRYTPLHTGLDMTDHDTEILVGTHGEPLDDEEQIEQKKEWKKRVMTRDALLAHKEGPSVDDPTVRVPSEYPANRFSEFDLDIVFSHQDARLRGRAVK
jgi:hypothetical protein